MLESGLDSSSSVRALFCGLVKTVMNCTYHQNLGKA